MEPVLGRHVHVDQLWAAARAAAGRGEKWGQRKKAVADTLHDYYSGLHRDRRGARPWVERVSDILGYFTPATPAATIEKALQQLDATGDVDKVIAALRADGTLPDTAARNTLYKTA